MRIATFNLENLDKNSNSKNESALLVRIPLLRNKLLRLNSDVLCLQEVHSQQLEDNQDRQFVALEELIKNTIYSDYYKIFTRTSAGQPYAKRNLVILSRFPISSSKQYLQDLIDAPSYKILTKKEYNQDNELKVNKPEDISWERPILHATLDVAGKNLHIINLHLKSKNPTNINGQKVNFYTWKTATGWAEGFFLSSLKRVGQALEVRTLVDNIFDQDLNANICIAGDFNSESDEVPMETILGRVENTGNSGLRQRTLTPVSKSIAQSLRFTLYHHGTPNMLDNIVLSRNMLARFDTADIYNEDLTDETIAFATDNKYPESDHAPVVANFDF